MEDNKKSSENQEEQIPKFRGLYRNVNIQLKKLKDVTLATFHSVHQKAKML